MSTNLILTQIYRNTTSHLLLILMMAAQKPEIVALLAGTSFFKDLPQQVLLKITSKIQLEIHPKGTILYRKGDVGNKLYLIASGEVALVASNGSEDKETTIAILSEGEIFGEMALLTGEPRSTTVKLETTSELYVLDKKDFDIILQENPTLALHLSRILSKRLALTTERSLDVLKKQTIFKPKLYLFLSLLEEPRNSIFLSNLAVSLSEQARKKVVVVELCLNERSVILEKLGLPSELPKLKDLENLSLRETFGQLRSIHPSGLTILPIPHNLFMTTKQEKAILVLNYLRSLFDYSLIAASPLNGESREFLSREANHTYLISSTANANREEIYRLITITQAQNDKQQARISEILLVLDGKDSFVDFKKIKIGWSRAIDRAFELKRNPFEALLGAKTMRAVERLARILGNLKIGLALGAGGALGYTSCGILKVLERERIYPDIIAGTSIGALIGAGYAKGLTSEEISEIALSTNKNWIRDILFWDLSLPKGGGFLGGVKLLRFLHAIFDDLEFQDLELPAACVATDILTGEEITINSGRVLDAIRSSISIPVIFKPYHYQDRWLVDGGLVNPVPASTLLGMGADIILAVKLTNSPGERSFAIGLLGKKEQPKTSPGVLDTFFRTILTMEHQIAENKAELAQVTIHPKTPTYNGMDFDKASELIPIGEKAAEEALPKIKALLPFFADYCVTRLKR